MRIEYQRLILPIAWAWKKLLAAAVLGVFFATIYYSSIFKYRVDQTIYIQNSGESSLQDLQLSRRSSGYIGKSTLTKSIIRSLSETNWLNSVAKILEKDQSLIEPARKPSILVTIERLRLDSKYIAKFSPRSNRRSFRSVIYSSINISSDQNSNIAVRVQHHSPKVAVAIANAAVKIAHKMILEIKMAELKETDRYIKTEISNINLSIEKYEREFSGLVRLNFETTNSLNSNDSRIETQLDSKITNSKIEYESIIGWFSLNGFPQESFFNESLLFDGISLENFNPLFRKLTKLKTLYEIQINPSLAMEATYSKDSGNLSNEILNLELDLKENGVDIPTVKNLKGDLPDYSRLTEEIKKMIELEQYIAVASNMLKSKTARSLSVQQIELKKLANIRHRDHLYRMLNNLSNRELDLRMRRISEKHKYKLPMDKHLGSARRTPSGSGIVLMTVLMLVFCICLVELLQDKFDPLVLDLTELEGNTYKLFSTIHESDNKIFSWLRRSKKRKFPEITPQFLNDIKFLTNKVARKSLENSEHAYIIGLTSTVPGEGKSFLAYSLAKEFKISHGRALMVDGDIIASKMGSYLENRNAFELVKNDDDFKITRKFGDIDFLEPLEEMSDFSLVKSLFEGKTPLSDFISRNYDLVLIDLPPIQLVPDAIKMLGVLNDLFYVVAARSIKRSMFLKSTGEISQMSTITPKVILNRSIKPYQKSYYSYGGNYLTTRKRAKNIDKVAS